ncbi:hypothetical protein OG453_07620 [Streptomyces sp. NBC_01381]|uniref:hypothetical protein n=1 Tax=Streptomyces sp. NBC_01381 TaxID=2903845 RepID=UPI0022519815|nr:hypothetical protein [Streptomyces sp. NBC_01381]MCX4666538.1 hypothetical protein [Streptomyces sp. NBC_01381]
MDLAAKHAALYQGTLLVAEAAEDAYRLGGLDRFLNPWIRDRLDSLRLLLDSCDTQRQLAGDTRALASAAAEYSEMRDQLFSDLHHTRPEPPWRTMRRKDMAIRAQSRVLHRQPTFILRRLDAGANVPGAETWDFTVLTNPSDRADQGTSFVVMADSQTKNGRITVQVSKELESERPWYQQLEYGFYALGATPFLTAIYDPDRHRQQPPEGLAGEFDL